MKWLSQGLELDREISGDACGAEAKEVPGYYIYIYIYTLRCMWLSTLSHKHECVPAKLLHLCGAGTRA